MKNPVPAHRSLATVVLALGLAAVTGACAIDDVPEEEELESSALVMKSKCLATKSTFTRWSDVERCETSNPPLYKAALGAVTTAGAKCIASTLEGCTDVSASDAIFAKWLDPWVGCYKDVTRSWPEGREYIECCFYNDLTGEPICDFAWIKP